MQIKRLFIEVDRTNDYNRWQLESEMDGCQDLSAIDGKDFWWKVISDARCEPKLIDYIKEADEIHMCTSFMPLVSYTSIGSPELWDNMLSLAIQKKITGKKVYNMAKFDQIEWNNLDIDLIDKAFKKNYLYIANDNYSEWEQVDIDQLIREFKKDL